MKKFTLAALLVIAIVFAFAGGAVDVFTEGILSETTGVQENEEKIYCNATLEDNFTDDIILVGLTKKATFDFAEYGVSDFAEIKLAGVSEITEQTVDKVKKQLEDEADATGFNKYVENTKKINVDKFRRILTLELADKGKKNVLNGIKALEKRSDVLFAEPNFVGEFLSGMPDDPYFTQGEQWTNEHIDLPQAWNIVTGTSTVLVGVVDSGIDKDHPDLNNRVNQQLSADFTGSNNPWSNSNGHGTHVAGIIGAEGNNGIGIAGTCWNVKLVSLKIGEGNPYASAVTSAIIYATNNDIGILNLSLIIYQGHAMSLAIDAYPGLLVCAAGNQCKDTDIDPSYPASNNAENIISVGGSNYDDELATAADWGIG